MTIEVDVTHRLGAFTLDVRFASEGRLTALFFQIDWRLGLLTDLQLAQLPMIDPKPW